MFYKSELHEVNGFKFKIGEGDFYAPVFMIEINGKFYGAWGAHKEGDELGWNSGVYATSEAISAIKRARELYADILSKKRKM